MEVLVEVLRGVMVMAVYGRLDGVPGPRVRAQRTAFRTAMLAGYAWAWSLLLAGQPLSPLIVLSLAAWALLALGLIEVESLLGHGQLAALAGLLLAVLAGAGLWTVFA